MNFKKYLTVLVILAVIQLGFPVGLFVYEDYMQKEIVQKGKQYTLSYTHISHFTKKGISLDTGEIYTVDYEVGQDIRNDNYYDGAYMYHDTLSVYSEVVIEEKEDGTVRFFSVSDDKELTKYNWFEVHGNFRINLADYEFVNESFGIKEFYDLGILLSEDTTNDTTFESFMQSKDGYYNGIWHIPLEGKVTLCVYDGYTEISEFYIGDELILKLK